MKESQVIRNIVLLVATTMLAACSGMSTPTYNALAIDSHNGARTYKVECHGLLSSADTCRKAAERICADKPVHVIDAIEEVAKPDAVGKDPRTLVFSCAVPAKAQAAAPAAPAPVPVPVPTVSKTALSADALFAFGKSGAGDISPKGQQELQQLAQKLRETQRLERVEVVGHTDRLGSAAANQRLSEARAGTVREVLVANGVPAAVVTARGSGATQPVVQCTDRVRQALIRCLAPNRRVDVVARAGGAG